MSLGRRILIHGLLAAVPLAVIGYLFAHAAGIWTASQSAPRKGPALDEGLTSSTDGGDVTAMLIVKLPLLLAIGGFLFVAVGEVVRSLWRPSKPVV